MEYLECYKTVNLNYTSIYDSTSFLYNKKNTFYETVCDFCEYRVNSKGFGCWTKDKAINYAKKIKNNDFRLLLCLVPIDSICILKNGKIRSNKLFILNEIFL